MTTTDGTQTTEGLTLKNFEVNQVFMIKDYIWNVVCELGHTSGSDMTRDEYMPSDDYSLHRRDRCHDRLCLVFGFG